MVFEMSKKNLGQQGKLRPRNPIKSVKEIRVHACLRLFSPRLDPILDGGKGHKDTVVLPQVPAGRAVGHAVFDHQPHCQIDHAMGVVTARRGQSARSALKYVRHLVQ